MENKNKIRQINSPIDFYGDGFDTEIHPEKLFIKMYNELCFSYEIVLNLKIKAFLNELTEKFDLTEDSFLLKYNSSGFLIWEKFWGTPGSDVSNGIRIDLNGSIYLGGSTETSGDRDVFLLKYDNNGNITWVKTWSEKPLEECDSLIIDDENFIYLGGIQNISNTNSQILLLKYDFKGNLLWNLTWGGLEYETCLGMTLDPFNNVILCGETGSFGAKNGDSFYVRFNSLGNLIDFYRVGDDNSEAFYDVNANLIENTYTIFLALSLLNTLFNSIAVFITLASRQTRD